MVNHKVRYLDTDAEKLKKEPSNLFKPYKPAIAAQVKGVQFFVVESPIPFPPPMDELAVVPSMRTKARSRRDLISWRSPRRAATWRAVISVDPLPFVISSISEEESTILLAKSMRSRQPDIIMWKATLFLGSARS